jgi:hypothetical protein
MEKFGIESKNLIFIDELDLMGLLDQGKLVVTLVDHNILPKCQASLKDVLVEIIGGYQRDNN